MGMGARLAEHSCRYVACASGLVVKVRRVTARDLLDAGVFDLPGLAEVQAALKAEQVANGGTLQEDAETLAAREATNQQRAQERMMRRLEAMPKLAVALEAQVDAFVVGGVVGLGLLRDAGEGEERPVGLLEDDEAEAWVQDVAHTRITLDRSAERILPEGEEGTAQRPEVLHTSRLHPQDRVVISGVVRALSSEVDRLRPFRAAAGAAGRV